MCSCDWNWTCARHREPSPDRSDGDDPYNETAAETHLPEFVVSGD